MHVLVSPVRSESALAWLAFARQALRDAAAADVAVISPELAGLLEGYLTDWERLARQGPELTLSFELPLDDAEYLVHGFLRVSDHFTMLADQRGHDIAPPEGDAFYEALVDAVFAALETADHESGTQFGGELRAIWPRLERHDPPS